jgi:Phosphotransferase enzyme family
MRPASIAGCARILKATRGQLTVLQFKGGQSNPTYRLNTRGASYVLRRKPFGKLLPSAHAVDREFRVIAALHTQGVPVPRPYALCVDNEVIGSAFYLMSMEEGRVFWNLTLPNQPPRERSLIFTDKIKTLPDINWYLSYNLFRLGGVTQGIAARIKDGTAATARAAESAAQCVPCAGVLELRSKSRRKQKQAAGAISYAQLDAAASRVAHGLDALDIRKGDKVALSCPNLGDSAFWPYRARLPGLSDVAKSGRYDILRKCEASYCSPTSSLPR